MHSNFYSGTWWLLQHDYDGKTDIDINDNNDINAVYVDKEEEEETEG